MPYRKGEHVLIEHDGAEMVCKCLQFFCVSTGHDKQCHTFIECAKYSFLECPYGDPETDLSTGNRIVSLPSASSVIVPVTAIKRKVILYLRVDPQ